MLAMNLCHLDVPSMGLRAGVKGKEAIWSSSMMKTPSGFCKGTSLRTGNGGLDSQGPRHPMGPQEVGAA
jgi:hypothetical protein